VLLSALGARWDRPDSGAPLLTRLPASALISTLRDHGVTVSAIIGMYSLLPRLKAARLDHRPFVTRDSPLRAFKIRDRYARCEVEEKFRLDFCPT